MVTKLKEIRKFTTQYLQRICKHTSKYIGLKRFKINPFSETLDSVEVLEHYIIDGIKVEVSCNIGTSIEELKAFRRVNIPLILSSIEKLPSYVKKALNMRDCLIHVCDLDLLIAETKRNGVKGRYYTGATSKAKKLIRVGYGYERVDAVLVHEIGHFIDNFLSECENPYHGYEHGFCISNSDIHVLNVFKEEAKYLNTYAQTKVVEYIAVAFEFYFLHGRLPKECKKTTIILRKYLYALKSACGELPQYEGSLFRYKQDYIQKTQHNSNMG